MPTDTTQFDHPVPQLDVRETDGGTLFLDPDSGLDESGRWIKGRSVRLDRVR